jgi:cysteine desulfurase
VGVLFIREGVEVLPVQTGGSQEFGLRAATQNIPLIMGMATAFHLVQEEGPKRIKTIEPLRDQVIEFVLKEIPDARLTGHPRERLPNHASFVFQNTDGNLLLQALDAAGFACSSGSACKTGDPQPSSVLTSLGFNPTWALGSLRVSLGKDSTPSEIQQFLEVLPDCVARTRKTSR